MAQAKIFYIGDVFGYRANDRLVLGMAKDREWPYASDSAVKPFIPIQSTDGIEWTRIRSPNSNMELEDSTALDVILLDRPFIEVGTRVRRNGLIGIVIEKKELATVKLMNDSAIIRKVPIERLMEISKAASKRQILFQGYIGEIESVTHKVKLTYADNSACTIDYEKDNNLYQGCSISPKFQELKGAKWAGGFNVTSLNIVWYISQSAKVSDIDVESLKVNWMIPLPPTAVADRPSPTLTKNNIPKVQYLPGKYVTPLPDTIWKMQITEQDLGNLHDTSEEFLTEILKQEDDENNENGENEEETSEKRQKLEIETRQVGTFQPVQVLLTQNVIQIEYIEDGRVEEIPSTDIDEILNQNSVEIPKWEYVFKIDETSGYKFGLDKTYYLGETDQSPMNPSLNPNNLKQITWFEVNVDDMTDVREIGTEEVSVFDLESLRLNLFMENSDYVTRVIGSDEFTVGTFSKILDNGKVELKDLDGNAFEKWPTEISIRSANNPTVFFNKVCNVPPEPNLQEFLSADHYDFAQTPVANVSSTLFIHRDQEPQFSKSFEAGIRRNLHCLINTSTPRLERTWVQTYSERQEFFTGIILGSQGGLLEDVLFLVETIFPSNYPTEAPQFTLNPCSSLEQNYLPQWDQLRDVVFQPWDPNATILDGLQISRDVIEGVRVDHMRYGDIWLPKEFFYPKTQLTDGETETWAERWREIICVQSMRYVYNQIAYPEDGLYKTEILGHYRRVLPSLMTRWRSWTVGTSPLFAQQSGGFVIAVMNQLQRFETILATNFVRDPPGNEANENETESDDEFEVIHIDHNPNAEQESSTIVSGSN